MLLTEPSPFKKMLLFGVPGGDLVIRDPLGKLCDSQSLKAFKYLLLLRGLHAYQLRIFELFSLCSGTPRYPVFSSILVSGLVQDFILGC
jgi:hypothetical protein